MLLSRRILLLALILILALAKNVFAQCGYTISISNPADGGCTAVDSAGSLDISGTTNVPDGSTVNINYHYGTTTAQVSSGSFSTSVNIPASNNSFDITANVQADCPVCCDDSDPCTNTGCTDTQDVSATNSYTYQLQPSISITSPSDGDTKAVEGPEYVFTVTGSTSNVPTGTDVIISGGDSPVTVQTLSNGSFSHSVTIQPSSSSIDITASVSTGTCGSDSDSISVDYSCLMPSISITSPANNTVLTGTSATTVISVSGTTTNIPVGTAVTITAGTESTTATVQNGGSFSGSITIPQSCNSTTISATADVGSCGTPISPDVNFEYTVQAPTLTITSPYQAVTIGVSYPQPTPTPFGGTGNTYSLPVTGTTNAPDGSQVAITGTGISEVDTTVSNGTFGATVQIPPTHDYININVTVTACGVSSSSVYFPVKYKEAPTLDAIPISIDPGDATYPIPGIEPGRPNEQIVVNAVDANADPITINVQMFNSSNTNLPYITNQTIPVSVITNLPSGYDQPFTFTAPATLGPYYSSSQRSDPNSNGSGDTNRVGDTYAFYVTLSDGVNPPQNFLVQGALDNLIPPSGTVLVTNNDPQQFIFKPNLNAGSSVNGTTWNGHVTWPLTETSDGVDFNHETATFMEPRWSLSGATSIITQFHGALDISVTIGFPFYSRQHGLIYLESVSYSTVHEYWEEYTTDWGGLYAHSNDQLGDFVVPGMVVNQDDEIGETGKFGVPNPHLHFGNSKITNSLNNIPTSNIIRTGLITSAFDFEMHPLFSSQSGYGIPDDGTTITGNAPPTIISIGNFTYDALADNKLIDDVTIGVTIQSGVTYVPAPSSPPMVITGDQNLFDIDAGALDPSTPSGKSQPGLHYIDLTILNSAGTTVAHPYNIDFLSVANPFQNTGAVFDVNSPPWVFPVTYFCWVDGGIPQNLSADLSSPDGNNGDFNSTVLGNNWGNYTVQFTVKDDQGNQAYAEIPALNDREVVSATPTPQISYPSVVEAFTTTVNAYYPSNIEFDYVYLGAPNDPTTIAPVTAHTQTVTEVVNPNTANYPATAVSAWNGNWDPGVVPPKYAGPIQPNNPLNATGVTTISGRSWYGNYRLEIYAKNTSGFTTNVPVQAVTITGLSITGAHGPMTVTSSNFLVDDSKPYSASATTYGDNLTEMTAGEQPGIALAVTNDGDQNFQGVVNMFPLWFDSTNESVTFPTSVGLYTINPGTSDFGNSSEVTGTPVDEQYVASINPNTPLGKSINIGVESISSPDGTNYYALYSSFTAPDPPPIPGCAIDEKPDLYDYGSVSIMGGSSPTTTYLPTTIVDGQNISNGTWGVSVNGTGVPQPGELIKFDVRVKNDGFSNIPVSIENGYDSINPAHVLAGSVTDEGGFSAAATQGFTDIFAQAISQFGSIQNVTVSPVTNGTGYSTMEFTVALNPVQPPVLPVTIGFTDQVTTSKDAGSQAVTYPYGNYTFPVAAVTWYFDNQTGHGSSYDNTLPAESGATVIASPGGVLTDTSCGTIYTNGPTSISSNGLSFNDYVFSASQALTDNVLFLGPGGISVTVPLTTASIPGLNPGGFNPGDPVHAYQELFQSALGSFTLQNGQITGPDGPVSIPDGNYTFSFVANDGVTNNSAGGSNAVTTSFSVNIDVNFPQVGLGANPTTMNSSVPGIYSSSPTTSAPLTNLCQSNGLPVCGGNIIIYGTAYSVFLSNVQLTIISPNNSVIYSNSIPSNQGSSSPSMAITLGNFNTAQTDGNGNLLYPDGIYTIQVTATDCAEHQTQQTVEVYFLNSPPTVAIQIPGPGQEVPDSQPLTIYGTVNSDALYSYQLYYASGGNLSTTSTSTSWIPMSQVGPNAMNVSYNQASSSNSPLNIFYFNGPTNNDPSAPVSLGDGIYTILLTATNCLGQPASFTTDFRMGNVSPVIETGNVPNNSITYSLVDSLTTNNPVAASVTINIYLIDTSGSVPVTTLVKNLVQGTEVPAVNPHITVWNGTDNNGNAVAATANLPAGQSYNFEITAVGENGVPSTAGPYTVVLNSLPTITINNPNFTSTPTFNLASGPITLDFDTISNPATLTVQVVQDSSGAEQNVVTLSSPVINPVNSAISDYQFYWNGTDQYGQTVVNGQYSFNILVTDSNNDEAVWDGFGMTPPEYLTLTGNSGGVSPDPGPSSREWTQGVSLALGQYLNILVNVKGLSNNKSGSISGTSSATVASGNSDGCNYSFVQQPVNSVQANYELVEMSQPNNAATFEWDGKDASVTIRPDSIAETTTLSNGAVSALYPASASINNTPYSFVLYNNSGSPVTAGSIPLSMDSAPPTLTSFTGPVSQSSTNIPVTLAMNFGELIKAFNVLLTDAYGNQAAQTVMQAPTNNFTTWPGLSSIDLRLPLEPSVNSLSYTVPLNTENESLPPGPYTTNVQMEDPAGNTGNATANFTYVRPVNQDQGGIIVSNDGLAWLMIPPQAWTTPGPNIQSFSITVESPSQVSSAVTLPGFEYVYNIYDVEPTGFQFNGSAPATLRLFYYDIDNQGDVEYDFSGTGNIVYFNSAAATWLSYNIASGNSTTVSGPTTPNDETGLTPSDLGIVYLNTSTNPSTWDFIGGTPSPPSVTGPLKYIQVPLPHNSLYFLAGNVAYLQPPQDLIGAIEGSAVRLDWAPPNPVNPNMVSYNILRHLQGQTTFTLLATVPATTTTYLDSSVQNGEILSYEVEAVDNQGRVSSPSNIVTIETSPLLTLNTTENESTVNEGQTIIYTAVVENTGALDDASVQLTGNLPAYTTLVSSNPPATQSSPDTLAWQLGAVDAGDSVTVSYQLEAVPATIFASNFQMGELSDDWSANDYSPYLLTNNQLLVQGVGAANNEDWIHTLKNIYNGNLSIQGSFQVNAGSKSDILLALNGTDSSADNYIDLHADTTANSIAVSVLGTSRASGSLSGAGNYHYQINLNFNTNTLSVLVTSMNGSQTYLNYNSSNASDTPSGSTSLYFGAWAGTGSMLLNNDLAVTDPDRAGQNLISITNQAESLDFSVTVTGNTVAATIVGNPLLSIGKITVAPPANPRSTYQPGEPVTYAINYNNLGSGNSAQAWIWDTLPDNLDYNSAQLPPGVSSASAANSNLMVWNLGPVSSGSGGSITLSASVVSGDDLTENRLFTEDFGYQALAQLFGVWQSSTPSNFVLNGMSGLTALSATNGALINPINPIPFGNTLARIAARLRWNSTGTSQFQVSALSTLTGIGGPLLTLQTNSNNLYVNVYNSVTGAQLSGTLGQFTPGVDYYLEVIYNRAGQTATVRLVNSQTGLDVLTPDPFVASNLLAYPQLSFGFMGGTASLTVDSIVVDGADIDQSASVGDTEVPGKHTSTPHNAAWVERPDIVVSKNGPLYAITNNPFTYNLSVQNLGSAADTAVTVTDNLPSGISFVSANPTPSSVSGSTIKWIINSLNAYSQYPVTLNVEADSNTGNAVNIASSTGALNSSSSSASWTSQVIPPPVTIVKAGPSTLKSDEPCTYQIVVQETGPIPVANVVVTDTLPAGVGYDSSLQTAPASTNPILVWNLGNMNPGNSVTIAFTVDAENAPGTVFSNQAGINCSIMPNPILSNPVSTTLSQGFIYPGNGEMVNKIVTIVYFACDDNYEVQWSPVGEDKWEDIQGFKPGADDWWFKWYGKDWQDKNGRGHHSKNHHHPVSTGCGFHFADWNTLGLKPGDYQLRLWDPDDDTVIDLVTVVVGIPSYEKTLNLPTPTGLKDLEETGGSLYALSSKQDQIYLFDNNDNYTQTLGGYGSRIGELYLPQNEAAGPNDSLYVADTGNNRVEVFGPSPFTFGQGILSAPQAIEVRNGVAYVLDGYKLYEFDLNGNLLGSFQAESHGPYTGVAVDYAGRIFLADAGRKVIEVYAPDHTYLFSFDGFPGFGDVIGLDQAFGGRDHCDREGRGDNLAPSSIKFYNDRLYITDSVHNQVSKFGLFGNHLMTFGGFGSAHGQFDDPRSSAANSQGAIYVADAGNRRLEKFNQGTGVLPTPVATPTPSLALQITGLSADPNPFNPDMSGTKLTYTLSEAADVFLVITGPSGNNVFQQTFQAGTFGGNLGMNEVVWNGTFNGRELPEGTYNVTVNADANGQEVVTQLMVEITDEEVMTSTPTPVVTPTVGTTPTVTPMPTGTCVPGKISVQPIAECVQTLKNGQFAVQFGYENNTLDSCGNNVAVEIPLGPENNLFPSKCEGGEPSDFNPGLVTDAFAVTFDSTDTVIWNLDGNQATATCKSSSCGGAVPTSTSTPTPVPPTPTFTSTPTPLPPTATPTSVPVGIHGFNISPNIIDRIHGPANVFMNFNLTGPASLSLQLENSGGSVVYSTSFPGESGANTFTYTYPGVAHPSQELLAGTYTFVLTATGEGGGVSSAQATLIITP